MAFPQVQSVTESQFASLTTTHNVSMPATVDAGDLLLAFIAIENASTITTPSGWTLLSSAVDVAARLSIYYKSAAGTEGGTTVNFATSGNEVMAAQVYRIIDWDSVEVGTSATGTGANPAPPSLNPSGWDTEDTLWIIACAAADDDAAVTAAPANYTNLVDTVSGAGENTGCTIGTARRELAAASVTPGTFTLSESEVWTANTVAIRPETSLPLEIDGFEETDEFGTALDFEFIKAIHLDGLAETDEFGTLNLQGIPFRWSIEHLEARTDYGFPTVWVELSGTSPPIGAFPTGEFFERRLLELPRLEEAEFGSRFGITGFRQVTLVLDNSDGLIGSLELQDSYVRLYFVDEDGNTREWKGQVTSWTLSHKCTVQVEDVDAIALTTEIPRRTINDIVDAEKADDLNFENVVIADDLGKPIPIVFGRNKKLRLLYIKADDANREYDYIIGEGEGLNGNNFQEVFTIYREEQALDSIEGDVASATSTTLTLESADRRPDSWYRYWWVQITAGTGAGQIRHVTAYDSTLNRITVDSAWSPNPNSGSDYRLREWRFYDGSQSSPYGGLAFIRFKKRMGLDGRTDAIYADLNGLDDETNVVRAIESILGNATWGLGLDTDSTTFNAAAALSAITAAFCEGVISDTTTIQDILEGSGDVQGLLSFRDMVLSKGDAIEIAVDQAKTSAHDFGLGDDYGWNNILNGSPEIVHLHPNEKVKNLKVRYRKNNKENDSYQHELTRQASANGVDHTYTLPFIYDHETADRWLDYKRKRIAAAIKTLAIDVGQEGGQVHRGERVTIHIPTLGLQDSNWEVTSCNITPAGANSLALVPYSSAPYTYVPITDEGGSLPVDESFDIPPDYSASLPDPLSNIVISMQKEIVGNTVFSYATFTFDTPEDNYGGAVVRVKELGDADSLYRIVFSAKGDQVNSGRTSTLTPGRLYVFTFAALNIDGSKEGLGIVMDNSGAGYLGGGDSTAPATPTGLTGAAKFGELIFTWNKNSEADVAYYEIEIYTATSGGSLLVKDEVLHLNDSSFTPIYKFTRQTGSLTSNLVGAARIRAVDHTGNPSSFTSRVGATTGDILQDDIENDEVTNKNRATVSSITLSPANTQIISASITKRSGTRIRIEFSMAIETGTGFNTWGVRLERGGSSIQNPWCNAFLPASGTSGVSAVYDDNVSSSGTFTYGVVLNFGSANHTGRNLSLRLLELRR